VLDGSTSSICPVYAPCQVLTAQVLNVLKAGASSVTPSHVAGVLMQVPEPTPVATPVMALQTTAALDVLATSKSENVCALAREIHADSNNAERIFHNRVMDINSRYIATLLLLPCSDW